MPIKCYNKIYIYEIQLGNSRSSDKFTCYTELKEHKGNPRSIKNKDTVLISRLSLFLFDKRHNN